jgi:hypothetical protein
MRGPFFGVGEERARKEESSLVPVVRSCGIEGTSLRGRSTCSVGVQDAIRQEGIRPAEIFGIQPETPNIVIVRGGIAE